MVEYALTRRSALGAAGAGAVLFTVASCSNERSDYAGEVKLDKYDNSAGSFEAATRDTPPKNVPKPIKPENADEKSVAGFYASLAYIAAAMQYMFATGDTVLTMTARSPRTRNTMFIIPQMSKYWHA